MIDESVLEEIAALCPDGGTRLLADVISAFREDTPKVLAELECAACALAAPQVRDLAHRLKSSFANVGALEASRRCAQLSLEAGQDSAATSARQLRDDFAELERDLVAFLARRAPRPR